MNAARAAFFVGLAVTAAQPAVAQAPGQAGDSFLIVPLRVHILTAPDIEMANCTLSDADIGRVVGHVNAIWHKAGVHFGLESIVREPADQQERFKLATAAGGGVFDIAKLMMLLPRASRGFDGFHVYFFRALPFNSAYIFDDLVFANEAARVRPVEGGGDDPVARVVAHALGNALGLPNDPEPANLMANGTSGVALEESQGATARKLARVVRGAATAAETRKAVEEAQARGDAAAVRRLRSWLAELSGAGADEASRRPDAPAAPDVTAPPGYNEFLVIPLRVHVLTARGMPEVDCQLSDADVARILSKVNRVWHNAGIHWGLESLVREPAARLDEFILARDLGGGRSLRLFRTLFPDASQAGAVVNVYYIHEFQVNGVWLGREALVKETAQLRPVEGGIDEPIPRVTAHELGHALGLPHRQNRTNLLASGTTGTLLNASEVETARTRARTISGAAPVADVRQSAEAAEAAGALSRARRLWTWLAEIPGAGAEAARKRLDNLERAANAPSQ
jgi:hypothetical protein